MNDGDYSEQVIHRTPDELEQLVYSCKLHEVGPRWLAATVTGKGARLAEMAGLVQSRGEAVALPL